MEDEGKGFKAPRSNPATCTTRAPSESFPSRRPHPTPATGAWPEMARAWARPAGAARRPEPPEFHRPSESDRAPFDCRRGSTLPTIAIASRMFRSAAAAAAGSAAARARRADPARARAGDSDRPDARRAAAAETSFRAPAARPLGPVPAGIPAPVSLPAVSARRQPAPPPTRARTHANRSLQLRSVAPFQYNIYI